jgi:hypothetical protein
VLGDIVTVTRFAGPPLLLIAALIGLIVGGKGLRRYRRKTRGTPAQRVSGGWRELVDLAVDLGAVRPQSETRRTAVASLGRVELIPLASAADAVNFGPADPREENAERYWADVNAVRARLFSQVSRGQRIRARLSLASFRRHSMGRRKREQARGGPPGPS